MRIPRDLSGTELVKLLKKFGYESTRQVGSHLRLTTHQKGEHHITIPQHDFLRVGTLSGIMSDVATHLEISKDQLIKQLLSKLR